MTSKEQKRQMRDYIVDRLQGSEEKIVPVTKTLVSGVNTSYVTVGDDGIVFLVDQKYTAKDFSKIWNRMRSAKERAAVAFYKDGKTFFRTAVGDEQETGIRSKRFKSDRGMSLKNYDADELRKMISFSPGEILINQSSQVLRYYQPESEKLEEGLELFQFKPVVFDYSHIDGMEPSRESERLRIWTRRRHVDGPLTLETRGLVARETEE